MNIPIIIVSYNRLAYLKSCVDSIINHGYTSIFIIDNKSTYEPLLKYYKENNHLFEVLYAPHNFGHNVMNEWYDKTLIRLQKSYYVYTDNDIKLSDNIPNNFLEFFVDAQKYFNSDKIGCALKIDNLPACYKQKQEVIEWEKKFWVDKRPFKQTSFYKAPIDTTFALVKPRGLCIWTDNSFRCGDHYAAEHLPWYEDTANSNDELSYYRESSLKGISHW